MIAVLLTFVLAPLIDPVQVGVEKLTWPQTGLIK